MEWTPTARFESPGLDPLYLTPETGWFPQVLDLGTAVPREVVDPNPDADGEIDLTTLSGGRLVDLEVVTDSSLAGVSLWRMQQQLKAFADPSRRSTLVCVVEQVEDPETHELVDGPELRLIVRGARWNDQGIIMRPDGRIKAQFRCPSGLLELNEPITVTGNPGDLQAQGGMTFPLVFPLVFTSSTPSTNGVLASNPGNRKIWPTITLYGPMTDPVVINSTTGQALYFTGLTIATGDYIRIDGAAKTVTNSAGQDYYDTLDFTLGSEWWQLPPGDSRIFVVPDTWTTPPASFDVTFRPAWL